MVRVSGRGAALEGKGGFPGALGGVRLGRSVPRSPFCSTKPAASKATPCSCPLFKERLQARHPG